MINATLAGKNFVIAADAAAQAALIGSTGGNGSADSGKAALFNSLGGLNLGKSNSSGSAVLEVHSGSNFAIVGMAHLAGGFGFEATFGADGTGGYSIHTNGFGGTGISFDDTGAPIDNIALNAYGSNTGWALRAADENDQGKVGIRQLNGGVYWFGTGSDYLTLTNYTALIPAAPSGAKTVTVPALTGTMAVIVSNNTGSGTALLGSNSPAVTNAAPYTWLKMTAVDGSTVYVPAWK